jgi:hypothetical protein
MPQDSDLDILGIRGRTTTDQTQNPPNDQERHRSDHHDSKPAAPNPRWSEPSP